MAKVMELLTKTVDSKKSEGDRYIEKVLNVGNNRERLLEFIKKLTKPPDKSINMD
jgi:hypothetical protein